MKFVTEKMRWLVRDWLCRSKRICPANAHTRVIYGDKERDPRIGWTCKLDLERNGSCWCGKLRSDEAVGS